MLCQMVKQWLEFGIPSLLTFWINHWVLKDLMNKFVDLATFLRHLLVIIGLLQQWAPNLTVLLNLFCLLMFRISWFEVERDFWAVISWILGNREIWLLLTDLELLLYLLIKIRLPVWFELISLIFSIFLLLQLLRSFKGFKGLYNF